MNSADGGHTSSAISMNCGQLPSPPALNDCPIPKIVDACGTWFNSLQPFVKFLCPLIRLGNLGLLFHHKVRMGRVQKMSVLRIVWVLPLQTTDLCTNLARNDRGLCALKHAICTGGTRSGVYLVIGILNLFGGGRGSSQGALSTPPNASPPAPFVRTTGTHPWPS